MPRGSGVKKLSDLFAKYKHTLKAPQASVVRAFVEVVDEVLNIPLADDMVSYTPSTRILTIKAPGPLKTEIQLHKDELLAHLRGRLGERHAPERIL